MREKLDAEMISVLEEEYINPFSVLLDEESLLNISSAIPVKNLLADEILQTEELGNGEIGGKWRKEVSWSVSKNKVILIQKYCKVSNCRKE